MKTKRYLHRADQVVSLWDAYNSGLNPKAVAKDFGVSYSQVNHWISNIQAALAGEKVVRKKCANAFDGAVEIIRSRSKLLEKPEPTDMVENPATKVERLWNELQPALGELALFMAEEKTKDIIEKSRRLEEEAKKSNILGFIQKRWESR